MRLPPHASLRRPASGPFPGIAARAAAGILLAVASPFVAVVVAVPPRPEGPPSGGGGPTLLREQLMHNWDTDYDGKIDANEAEIARSKMRSKRLEQLRRDSVDPITGRKRGEIEDEKAGKSDRGRRLPEEESGRPILGVDDLLEPVDPGRGPTGARTNAAPGRAEGRQGAAASAPWRRSGSKAVPPAGAADTERSRGKERSGIATGGVRAGAPPARPGYGAAMPPKETKPLNAGRPIESLSPGGAVAGGRGSAIPGAGMGPGTSTANPRGSAPRGAPRNEGPARPGQPAGGR